MALFDDFLNHPDIVKQPDAKGEAKAWCPWHDDRAGGNPSLGINVTKKIVKCFVCGAGGIVKLAEAWDIAKPTKASTFTIQKNYRYRDEKGKTLYEVCRAIKEDGKKTFPQRRVDPSDPSGFKWGLTKTTRRVPYMLPELLHPEADEQIVIVEGEKDVDNLAALGILATTNSEGAGKWRPEWSPFFERRHIVIIPDNDDPGRRHADSVAAALKAAAYSIKIVSLDGLARHGDISDWIEAGHTKDDLLELIDAAPLLPDKPGGEVTAASIIWEGNKHRPVALQIIDSLKSHGFFVRSVDGRNYYFDRKSKQLGEVGSKENSMNVVVILNQRYKINKTESLYGFLSAELEVEAAVRGLLAFPRHFAHYDAETNCVYLDTFDGNVLKLNGKSIEVRDNGEDGVLFATLEGATKWTYQPDTDDNLLKSVIVDSINFDDDQSPYTTEEQRLLMLSWILSIAFASVQPTKPLALAVGPGGSGKSNLFRRIGMILFGPEYEVDALRKDKEEDFWTKVTNGPFATFDNADTYIPWLLDALAKASTGIKVTKKRLYTNNQSVSYVPKCFISLTARTPTFRREDVASRLLIFYLARLDEKIAEYKLLDEINSQRDALMSNYAELVNEILGASPDQDVDANLRLADFATLCARIGNAFFVSDLMDSAMLKVRRSQMTFATEESALYLALDRWMPGTCCDKHFDPKLFADVFQNEGRKVLAKDLLHELQQVSDHYTIPFKIKTPNALGMQIRNMADELAIHFDILTKQTNKGRSYEFQRTQEFTGEQEEIATSEL